MRQALVKVLLMQNNGSDNLMARYSYQHRVTLWRRVFRGLIHIPVGVINAWIVTVDPMLVGAVAGILFFGGFIFYEYAEDWRIADHAYVDLQGWLVGFPLYYIAMAVLKV